MMNTLKSKPKLSEVIARTNKRKDCDLDETNGGIVFEAGISPNALRWIDKCTTGPFNLMQGKIAFKDEKHAVMFSLLYL